MPYSLKTLSLKLAPFVVLAVVLAASFRLVHTDNSFAFARPAGSDLTPVTPQAVSRVVSVGTKSADATVPEEAVVLDEAVVDAPVEDEVPATKEEVWAEITQAIAGLNELVGEEMFLDVRRKQKGQMEIGLDGDLWKRVRYQTRVDLKRDISDLWHLFVKEYGNAGSSVVYFMNDSDGKVIDIFSKAE